MHVFRTLALSPLTAFRWSDQLSIMQFKRYLRLDSAPLAHIMQEDAVCMTELGELWYREYQVLPNRTHPTMMMNATGGYILTATKVTGRGG